MRKSTIGLIRSLRKLLLKISLPVNMFEEFFQGKLTLEILFFFIFFVTIWVKHTLLFYKEEEVNDNLFAELIIQWRLIKSIVCGRFGDAEQKKLFNAPKNNWTTKIDKINMN